MVVVILETAKDNPKFAKAKGLDPDYPTRCVEMPDFESAIKTYGDSARIMSIETYHEHKQIMNDVHGVVANKIKLPWWKRLFKRFRKTL